ncbi:DUF6221 family protein [Streptomyces collinus]|uniref:DUF6221 family protein n=1 Tax=Streptomyces collinus TaxID=42684 RepID=UPI0037F86679
MTDESIQRDLLAWLDTAISIREEAARGADSGSWMAVDLAYEEWDATVGSSLYNGGAVANCHMEEARHIALHDPRSVLRRCAADRGSLNAYAATLKLHDDYRDRIQAVRDRGGLPDAKDLAVWSEASSELAIMVGFVLNLAKGYGWGAGEDV